MDLFIPPGLTPERLNAIIGALPRSRNKDYLQAAKNIIDKNAYSLPPFGVVKFTELVDWKDKRSRSFERLIHGFTFLGCLLDAYVETKDIKYIKKSNELIYDWLEKHSYNNDKGNMAFHDETTALRLQYFLRFYIFARNIFSDQDRIKIQTSMWETVALLADDGFHSTNTNHGMFQDISLLLFSFYFEGQEEKLSKSYIKLAVKRLKDYFLDVYTKDGVHKEQSPSYHMLVASNIKKLISWMEEIDPIISQEFRSIFNKSEEFSTFIIRPDGCLPPMCDTEPKPVKGSSYAKLYNSDSYRFAVSAGKSGIPPEENDKVFPEAGYAIFRDDWLKKEDATYVLFSAAYNANYHKHSDDLNLTIYSGGEIITEAGPNGYNYQDPFTKYAYSSFAHNTLIVDGLGLPRTDGKFEKVYLSDFKISQDVSEATGINQRFTGVTHARNVKYKKQIKEIIVNDEITSLKRHEYKLLWHVAPNIKIHIRDRFIELFREGIKVMEIEFETNAPINIYATTAQEKPSIQGWHFPKMEKVEPLTTLEIDLSGSNANLTTVFRLNEFKLGERLPFELESSYDSTRNVRYHFVPSEDDRFRDKLLVVFSAMAPTYKFVYNYMRSLEEIKANKLFILDDFGDQGSYYIGHQRDFAIETAVSSLIQYIMSKNGILNQNVISIGSSKGGYAALLFGLKYHFGHVIAGAPQTKLGHFLINQAGHQNIAEYISGNAEDADRYYLDNILYQLLSQPIDVSPKINILIGNKDHHYKNHVIPLYDALMEKGFNVALEVKNGSTHEDVRTQFPPYLIHHIKTIFGISSDYRDIVNKPKIKSLEFKKIASDRLRVKCNAEGSRLNYAYYIYKNNELILKNHYTKNDVFEYQVSENGDYFIRVFVKDSAEQKVTLNSNTIKL